MTAYRNDQPSPSSMSAVSIALKIVIALTTLCLFLVIGEYAARYWLGDVTTTRDRSYFFRRWLKTVDKNSWGFREREFDLRNPLGVYRIAIIGDSITYGQGIEVEQRFSNVLERQLNNHEGKRKYEVLNFGRNGAETVDEVQFLLHPVLNTKPDFVLLQWYQNDVEGHDKNGRPSFQGLVPSPSLQSLFQANSVVFYLLNEQWITLQSRLGWVQSYKEYMLARFTDPNSPSSVAAKSELQKFIDICKQHGIPLGMVLFTHEVELGFLADRVLALCQREAIPCLDLRETFAEHKPDWASRLDPHPGPSANRLVADRLMQTFSETWRVY